MLFLKNYKKCYERFIFLHIPKTGGTSVERALGLHGCGCHWHTKSGNFIFGEKIETIKRKIPNWKNIFKFCFVRNPWEKLVSTYFYLKTLKSLKHQPIGSHKTVNLAKITYFEEWIIMHDSNIESLETLNGFWLSPQVNWIGENFFDFIGKFENINEDFNKIFNLKLTKLNKTNHENYRLHYNEKTKKIVEKWYEKDIINFNYKF